MAGGKLRETLSRLMVPAQGVFLGGVVSEGEGERKGEASAKRRGKKIPRGEDNETGKVRGADNSP